MLPDDFPAPLPQRGEIEEISKKKKCLFFGGQVKYSMEVVLRVVSIFVEGSSFCRLSEMR